MSFLSKYWLERLLNLGLDDESGNDLNQKQVVNLTCLLFCTLCFLLTIVFFVRQTPSIALFYLAGVCVGCFGFYLSYMGRFYQSRLLMPFAIMVQITIPSLFFFGAASGVHWLLTVEVAYAFTAFGSNQSFWRFMIVVLSLVLFTMCEYYGDNKGFFLTAAEQRVVAVFSFLNSAILTAVVVNLVVGRLRALNDHLRTLAEKDELTGLANRRKVLADAVNIFADSVMNQESCVFAILDLDHFKKINDTFGHEAGDLVLCKVAGVMRDTLRDQDEIGRYGGEEFIAIMKDTKLSQAEEEMERMRAAVENMLIETEQGIVIPVTISIGLASIAINTSRYEEILAQADKALYEAKRSGRNRVCIQSTYR